MIPILFAMAAASATHSVDIPHGGKTVGAVYTAHAQVKQRTVGAHTPSRADGRQCLWTATILVDRTLADTPALTRRIATDRRLSGRHAGPCAANTDRAEREVARRQDTIREELFAAAEHDRSALLAELEGLRKLAAS